MRRRLGVGPASLTGLRWLGEVGPAPLDAWALAMGWGQRTAYSHAERLVEAGWVARCQTIWRTGPLVYATAAGVRVAEAMARPLARAPAPTWWGHCRACAWTAAWLTVRGRRMLGPRRLLMDDSWRGELVWQERDGVRRRAHRPDLAGGRDSGLLIAIEVELAVKSRARLRSVLALHASWIAASKTGGVMYVCGNEPLARRVEELAGDVGLDPDRKTLRVELLEAVRSETLEAVA